MISTRSAGLVIDTVVCLTLAKWETVSGRFAFWERQGRLGLPHQDAPARPARPPIDPGTLPQPDYLQPASSNRLVEHSDPTSPVCSLLFLFTRKPHGTGISGIVDGFASSIDSTFSHPLFFLLSLPLSTLSTLYSLSSYPYRMGINRCLQQVQTGCKLLTAC